MARLRRRVASEFTRWGPSWIRPPGQPVLFYQTIEHGFEVPLDRISLPPELWQTLIHFGFEKSYRHMLGLPASERREMIDLGSFTLAIHDICDVWRIYYNGMSTERPASRANEATRWLLDQLARLPAAPNSSHYATFGHRLSELADQLDLREFFTT